MIKNIGREFVKVLFAILFAIFGKPKIDRSTSETLELYNQEGEFNKLFSIIRFWDAPFAEIDKLAPKKGKIIDLGCGDGITSNYLALRSKQRNVLGIEIDKSRVKEAYKGLKNTKFLMRDITKFKIPKSDVILLVHVLHHLPSKKSQEELLKKLKTKINKNGKLIIVEIVEKPFWKYIITWLTDAFIIPVIFSGKLYDFNFHYRREEQWKKLLSSLGYKLSISHPHQGKPFSHVIFVCQ